VEEGDAAIGVWCFMPCTFSVEVIVASDVDYICIDMQHGLIGYETLVSMLQVIPPTLPKIVRVPQNEPNLIGKTLDAGADGVIIPLVNSVAEAEAAADACRYPPDGSRSWGPTRVAMGDPDFGPEVENRRVLCMVMIETVEAVGAVDEILSVPGVDAAWVGPSDLSLSLSGRLDFAGRDAVIEEIRQSCERQKKIPCIAHPGPENVRRWRQAGFRVTVANTDYGLLGHAAAEFLREARGDR
jgi:4-hydroxy-2-oxoheptanedioate aldolase